MAVCLAVLELYDAVVATFTAEAHAASHHFGWREPQRHKTGEDRIVWVPGDPTGNAGEITSARNPGRNPRPLATLEELVTVRISGADSADAEDERDQYQHTRELFDAWYRAVHLASYGSFRVESVTWNLAHNLRRRGAELVVVLAVDAALVDKVRATAPVDTGASIDVQELDHSETLTVPAP